MADRSTVSLPATGLADCSSAITCTGRLTGEARSAAVPGTNDIPVSTPPALTVTTAVACCHQGLPEAFIRLALLLVAARAAAFHPGGPQPRAVVSSAGAGGSSGRARRPGC